jgi:hypothetical protein
MPVHVEKKPVKNGGDWAIVERSGRIVGRSTSKAKAEAAARARNAAAAKKRKK